MPHPRGRPHSYHTSRAHDREVPPRIYTHTGRAATLVQVAHGPCLKVDLSVRMVQAQTVLEKLDLLWQLLQGDHENRDLAEPNREQLEEF